MIDILDHYTVVYIYIPVISSHYSMIYIYIYIYMINHETQKTLLTDAMLSFICAH